MFRRGMLSVSIAIAFWTSPIFTAEPVLSGLRTPAESAECFQLADETLAIELVVSEPDIVSPVAMAWDANSRMYVAEMLDYPLGPMRGQIRLLTDTDNDGRYDRSRVFAENLPFPTSVLPWLDGVLVASAPDILFLRDSDGDDLADERRVVLTGFGEGNQQLRVNGLNYGLDNWVYGANGRSDGEIRRPDQPDSEAVSIRRRDFRFRPDTGEIQAIVGFSQYGLPRDNWGNRFPSWNTIPIRHVVLDEPRTRSTSQFDAAAAVANIVDQTDDGRIFSISPRPQTFNSESTDFYNAMCGLTIFRGDALEDSFVGQAFVGESLTNVIHRRVLEPAGPTFIARRVDHQCEFLASSDNWFHPVWMGTGPDGALYVADFYRRFVEHPNFAAAHLKQGIDWREGAQRGRIWRIVRRGQSPRKQPPQLASRLTSNLVAMLTDANGWTRDTAQRLIVERQDRRAAPLLGEMIRQSASSLGRLHALWTLSGLNCLDDDVVTTALNDQEDGIRAHAVRLVSENKSPRSERVQAAIMGLANSRDPRLRLEIAQVLVQNNSDVRAEVLAALAIQPDADHWLLSVLESVSDDRAWTLLQSVLRRDRSWLDHPTEDRAQFLSNLAARVALGNNQKMLQSMLDLHSLLDTIVPELESNFPVGCAALISGIDLGLQRKQESLRTLIENPQDSRNRQLTAVSKAIDAIATDSKRIPSNPSERVRFVRLFKLASPSSARETVLQLIQSGEPAGLQTAAIDAIVQWSDVDIVDAMLNLWSKSTPTTRRIVQAACLRNPLALDRLITKMEAGAISPVELDQTTRVALERLPDAVLRSRTEKLLKSPDGVDRQQIVANYEPTLNLVGDSGKGAALFAVHCATCHRIRGAGHTVGPDLSSIAARPKASLLVDILDPSRQVPPEYVTYTLVTQSGKVFAGLITSETSTMVTLRRNDAAEDAIPREEIEELRASGKSLMPDGMEQKLDQQQLADLLEFLYRPDITFLKQQIKDKR